ncbi:MAG: recombinase RecT [Spirochaetaceae bacterium]|nr:recombinase RecT [Spirochaetaceae bacterium]
MSEKNQVAVRGRDELMPQSVEGKMQMAGILAKSGLVPNTLNTPEKVFIALQWGHELGLSPMSSVNNVVPINGKPALSADVMYALARSNPEYGGIEWKQRTPQKAEVVITRISPHGAAEKFTGYFDLDMAKQAGLSEKETYRKFPDRMLRARALSRACKEAFPDVFAGVYTEDEAEEFDRPPMRDVTEPAAEKSGGEELAGRLASDAEAKAEREPSEVEKAAALAEAVKSGWAASGEEKALF